MDWCTCTVVAAYLMEWDPLEDLLAIPELRSMGVQQRGISYHKMYCVYEVWIYSNAVALCTARTKRTKQKTGEIENRKYTYICIQNKCVDVY